MEKNMYLVSSASDKVKEYFNDRNSAIAFIVDEFATALIFRDDKEGDRLTEYMKSHDETPNQYPFKYFVNEVKVNHDYDKPNMIYIVDYEEVRDGQAIRQMYVFDNLKMGQERFDELVDEDVRLFGEDTRYTSQLNSSYYSRWNKNDGYIVDHYDVKLRCYIDKKNGEFE